MPPLLVNILTFLAVFLAVCAVNAVIVDLRLDERRRLRQRMEEQFRIQQRERARTSPLVHDFSQIAADALADEGRQRTLWESLRQLVDQSGLDLSVARLLAIASVVGACLGLVGALVSRSLLMGGVLTLVGAALPLLYVQFKRQQRLQQLRQQLPDAFDMMSRVLRAGQTISQAMQAVAEEFTRPIALEFLYCYEQMNLGLSPEAALRDLGRRTGLLEMKIFILAVLVHRQTGGNLAELLDKLSEVVRERFRIQGMIRSLTAQGRLQAGILLSLPPIMFLVLMLLNPRYEMLLLEFPILLVIAVAMMGMGWLWIRKIVNFDF
jgi:tight adherence protein B